MLRRVIAWTLLVTVSWTTYAFAAPPAQSTEDPDQLTYEQAKARLDQFMELIEELRSHIDRSQFDLDALLDKLDYDPDKIIEFVKNDIAFEQYPGLLRGAKGTLMSRAGNALDQSVLLATLLKDAGADARIARGELSAEDARRLLDRMFLPRPARPSIGDWKAMDQTVAQITGGDVSEEPSGRAQQGINEFLSHEGEMYATAEETSRDFRRRLTKAGVKLGDPSMPAKLTAEARDYFWVEYRLGTSELWKSVHSAFGDQTVPSVRETATLADAIPKELQQRLRFGVEIEQQSAGRLTRKEVMSGWERPVANLIGLQMRYANVPSGLKQASMIEHPEEMARKTEFFTPVFNGKLAPGAQLFDLNGVTAPPIVGSSPALGVVKQVGAKTEAATSALSTLGAKAHPASARPDIRSLTGTWFVYTLIEPGGHEKTIRRIVYDAVGDQNRREGRLESAVPEPDQVEATLDLARGLTFMVSPCDYPPAYIVDRVLTQLAGLRETWESALRARYSQEGGKTFEESLGKTTSTPEFALFPAIASGVRSSGGIVSYQGAPTIVSTWFGERLTQGRASVHTAVDVVAQGRRILRGAPDGPVPAIGAAMTAGVWTTKAEQLVPLAGNRPLSEHVGAPTMLEGARKANVQLKVIGPRDVPAVDGLDLPAEVRAIIKGALADGYAVIAPESLSEGIRAAWWRVDPLSGQTLGMGPEGRGADLTEYLIGLMIAGAFAYVLSRMEYHVCISKGCEEAQCTKEATHSLWMGLLIGATVALVGAVATLAVPALAGLATLIAGLDLSEAASLELYLVISDLTKLIEAAAAAAEGVESFEKGVKRPYEVFHVFLESQLGSADECGEE